MFEMGWDVDTYTMTNVDVNTDINAPCVDLRLDDVTCKSCRIAIVS